MKRLLLIVALLVCSLSLLPAARAQHRAALDALRAEARARVVAVDTLLQFRTRAVPGGRMDIDEKVLRAAYRIATRVAAPSPEAAARAYLAAAAPAFGWAPDAPDLALHAVDPGRYSTHLVYRQTFFGLPVYGRQVKVSLNRDGQPAMVLSGYAPHLATVRRFDARPSLSSDEAAARVRELVSALGAQTNVPELVVYPSKQPRLAWHLLAWPQDAPAEWSVLLDAHTGEVIQLLDQSTDHRGETRSASRGERAHGTGREAPALSQYTSTHPPAHPLALARTQGSGLAFDPDPLTTAGVEYGGAYVDAGDADAAALNAQRLPVALNDITRGSDGLYRLEGPYVVIDGSASIGSNASTPPAEADPNGFRYGRADDFFEAVMSYYHVDTSQRYVQALDVGRAIQAVPLRVNPHGLGNADDSKYFPDRNAIAFGDGGIDDAEDADVIWHEYGHALLQGSAPGLLSTDEGKALHEGWSDYWAASYSRGLIDAGKVPVRDWRKIFTWDGNETWNGRFLNSTGRYPDDTPCATGSCDSRFWYQDGDLWATTLMEIYDVLAREVTDRLNLASHGYLSPPATFADAAHALIQADVDYYDGRHAGTLIDVLGARGYVDPTSFGPVVIHEQIPYVEQAGSTVTIDVGVTSVTAPVESVVFIYRVDGGPEQQLTLTAQGDDHYGGALTLPSEAAVVTYYIEAVDAVGQRTLLPRGAPEETFGFSVGPDAVPPQITHQPIEQAALQAWPVSVIADVSDNQGVDSVWVPYRVEAADGAVQAEGSFRLHRESGRYIGAFPVARERLGEGSTVHYRLHALDVAATPNEAVLPATGTLSFPVVLMGVLASFDFESDQGVQATGVWSRGAPVYGLRVAHSGTRVWGTGLSGPYPGAQQHASLSLPLINLAGLEGAYLVFWHWYDFEHSGDVAPDRFTTESFWDGGNVKVSADGGASWTVLEPEGGYNGRIEQGTGNPLAGEPAFGGYSFGWRRVVAPLPLADNLRIRFDFGTDATNELAALFYAGWFLDDVRITTELPADTAPPALLTHPPAVIQVDDGHLPPPIVVQATDNTGLEAVLAEYTIIEATGLHLQSTLRLAMDPADPASFAGTITPPGTLGAGDRIEYRLLLRDFDGNTAAFPAANDPPLRFEYRLTESLSALGQVRATGLWQQQNQGWTAGATGGTADARSSLVLTPFDLPANADQISFVLTHRYNLGDGLGGNLKISLDDGASWEVLAAEGGYGAVLAAGEHPMNGEQVFAGPSGSGATTMFDLVGFAGRQVRLRLDFGVARALQAAEFWSVEQAALRFGTLEDGFEVPRTLALHPNFPDPFSVNTTLGYTLPEAMPVRLELYNILGQRVAVLVDQEQPAGTYTLTMSRGSLAGGVYLLRMLAGNTRHVERMVITP